jgi:hypothetical protein
MMRRRICLLAWLSACGPGTPGSDGSTTSTATTGDTTSGVTSGATTTSGGTSGTASTDDPVTMGDADATTTGPVCFDTLDSGADETGGSTGSGEPIACSPPPGLPCAEPLDCADGLCGNHVSLLDNFGCPRATCMTSADCAPGEACSTEAPLAEPLAGSVSCVDDQGVCTCEVTDVPASGVCMPEVLVTGLAGHCDTLNHVGACARFDIPWPRYCRWTPTRLFCDGACAVAAESAACIYFQNVGNGCSGDCEIADEDGFGYSRPRAGGSEFFVNHECGDEPTLWSHCIEAQTGACTCMCDDL